MGEALLFGLLASSALVIGGALGSYWQPSTRITGASRSSSSSTGWPLQRVRRTGDPGC
jgi:hypothetical protein